MPKMPFSLKTVVFLWMDPKAKIETLATEECEQGTEARLVGSECSQPLRRENSSCMCDLLLRLKNAPLLRRSQRNEKEIAKDFTEPSRQPLLQPVLRQLLSGLSRRAAHSTRSHSRTAHHPPARQREAAATPCC
jgi:hypothetical protein